VAGIFYCPHKPEDNCACRKPKTGMLRSAEKDLGLSLKGAPFIGDSLRDLQAARIHGCVPILVRTGKGTYTEQELDPVAWHGMAIYDNLAMVADALLGEG
jgi:D-glycero-D-manno-heptose 1,7-bisphosphate phosphatase